MKKITLSLVLACSFSFSFDFNSLANNVLKSTTKPTTNTQTKKASGLSDSTVTSGLKEALNVGVNYAIQELSKENGYLDNSLVKIPLPDNLITTEKLIRKVGGDKIADDLIISMNNAAAKSAPKTATIFMNAIDKMSMNDVQTILIGNDNAATEYFQKNTTTSLKSMIKPIIQESMQENKVASYYDTFNNYYKDNAKKFVDESQVMGYAKSFGVDSYLPGSSDESLDDYVTQKAIDGLFKMIASKEAEIRKDPVAQTTSLLKQVFGKL